MADDDLWWMDGWTGEFWKRVLAWVTWTAGSWAIGAALAYSFSHGELHP